MRLDLPVAYCRANNRDGHHCKKPVGPGQLVCRNHGGAASQVVKKEKERLAFLAPTAVDALLDIVTPRNPCVACGRSDATRDPLVLAAAKVILDKCGIDQVTADERIDLRFIEFLTDEDLDAYEGMVRRAQERAAAALGDDTIIDVTPEPSNPAQAEGSHAIETPRGPALTAIVPRPHRDSFGVDTLPAPRGSEPAPADTTPADDLVIPVGGDA